MYKWLSKVEGKTHTQIMKKKQANSSSRTLEMCKYGEVQEVWDDTGAENRWVIWKSGKSTVGYPNPTPSRSVRLPRKKCFIDSGKTKPTICQILEHQAKNKPQMRYGIQSKMIKWYFHIFSCPKFIRPV